MDENALRSKQGQEPIPAFTNLPAGSPYRVADVDWRKWGLPYPLIPEVTEEPTSPVYPDVEWDLEGNGKRVCNC